MDKDTVEMLIRIMLRHWPSLPHEKRLEPDGNWVVDIKVRPVFVVRNLDDWDSFWESHLVELKGFL